MQIKWNACHAYGVPKVSIFTMPVDLDFLLYTFAGYSNYHCSMMIITGALSGRINRIYHRSPMQTEKFHPEGKRIMPETRFTEFPALSVDSRVWISQSASETGD